jgi:soluble lytic murein transglycosylase-like protein
MDIQADERPSKEVIKARLDRAVARMIWALQQAREVAPTEKEEEAAIELIAMAERLKAELDEAFADSESEEPDAEGGSGGASPG